MKSLYLITIVFLLSSCSSLFYHPDRFLYSDPKKNGFTYEQFELITPDGIKLVGWHLKRDKKFKEPNSLILHFHGNAQNISSHYISTSWLTKHGHDVLIFDYRGYGLSEGSPNHKGTQIDVSACLDYGLSFYKKEKFKKLIVVGQSLGGTIVLRAIENYHHKSEIDLLMLDSTFLSYRDIAFDKLSSNWLTFLISPLAFVLVTDTYAPKDINKLKIPTLITHGTADEIVPFRYGEEINQKASSPKWFWKIEDGNHIDVFLRPKYRKEFLTLVNNL